MSVTNIAFLTYNVGNSSSPDKDLRELFGLLHANEGKENAHFYVVAFQNLRKHPQDLVMGAFALDPWTKAVQDLLNQHSYVNMKTVSIHGMALSLFALDEHMTKLRDVDIASTKSRIGDKNSATAIRVTLGGCSLCFVNLQLGVEDITMHDRINDFYSAIARIRFHSKYLEEVFLHDYVFVMGDLHFRLLDDYELDVKEVHGMIKNGNLHTLLQHDELLKTMSTYCLPELVEGHFRFPPTYKLKAGTQEYDDKLTPAWADRILYKGHNEGAMRATLHDKSYKSHPSFTQSDHIPVSARFSVSIYPALVDVEKTIFFGQVNCWTERQNNEFVLNVGTNFAVSQKDWIGIYRSGVANVKDYMSYEYVHKLVDWTIFKRVLSKKELKSSEQVEEVIVPPTNKHEINYQAHTCSFPGTPLAKDLNEQKVMLLYIHETSDGAFSILASSNPFHVLNSKASCIQIEKRDNLMLEEISDINLTSDILTADPLICEAPNMDSSGHGGLFSCFSCMFLKNRKTA